MLKCNCRESVGGYSRAGGDRVEAVSLVCKLFGALVAPYFTAVASCYESLRCVERAVTMLDSNTPASSNPSFLGDCFGRTVSRCK